MRCRSCRRVLPPRSRVCPVCGETRPLSGRRFVVCSSCGARSPRGLHLCPLCGEVLHVRHRWGWIVLALAAGCVGIYLVVNALGGAGSGEWAMAVERATDTPAAVSESPAASQTIEAEPSVTATATSAPTVTSLPTSSPTAHPSATPTPFPTDTATPLPTDTPEPLIAMNLVSPEDGTRFQGRRTRVILQWESVGALGEDEWYGVSLRYWAEGNVHYSGAWVKEDQWLVPKELHRKPDPREPGFEWDVTLMLQTGTK